MAASPRPMPSAITRARIRAHTIGAASSTTLRQFEAAVHARGGHVHWAETAGQAVAIVVDIARQHGVRPAVKSKSMVSEEIELNAALDGAGVRRRRDRPRRVHRPDRQRPAVAHRRADHPQDRHDIAESFRGSSGATRRGRGRRAADDGVRAAPAARRVPARPTWASRAATSASPRPAASASHQRRQRAADDDAAARARRADGHRADRADAGRPRRDAAAARPQRTGQKLTVYTNIITGPTDGPGSGRDGRRRVRRTRALHIVLVDNGRSRLLGGELAEILYCIRCGACLNACPVYQQVGGHAYGSVYPGPGRRGADAGRCAASASWQRPAAGEQPLRRVPRGLPRPHRHPADAAVAARPSPHAARLTPSVGRPPACGCCAVWRNGRGLFGLAQTRGRPGVTGLSRATAGSAALPGHLSGGPASRDFPALAPRNFMGAGRRGRR